MAAERLSGLDLAFACLERPGTPMHMGALLVFDPARPGHPARLTALLRARAAANPRLRVRIRDTCLPQGGAVWSEDTTFAANRHVHAHRLPRPGNTGQLVADTAARMADPLPPGRPPWELHVITGLADGQFAVLAKMHHALADGAGALIALGSLLDDIAPTRHIRAAPAPADKSSVALRLRDHAAEALRRSGQAARIAAAVAAQLRPAGLLSPLASPTGPSERRRVAVARVDADELRRTGKPLGATLNDVMLAALAGGLRRWLLARGDAGQEVRALIPVSMRVRVGKTAQGNHLSGYLLALPVGEPDAIQRVSAVREAMLRNKAAGPASGAGALPLLASWLHPVCHRLLTPLIAPAAPLLFDTVVTSVPWPDISLRLDGAELREIYPLVPIAPGQALGVATAVYRGSLHVGLLADPETVPDVARLGDAVTDAATELAERCVSAVDDLG